MALTKDPDAVLDYTFDWSAWLDTGETIIAHEVVVEAGDVVIDSTTATDTLVVAWLSGGTLGTDAEVRCRVTTSEGRIDDRTIRLLITEASAAPGCEAWPVIGCNVPTTDDYYEAAARAAQAFLNGATGGRLGVCTVTHRFQVRTNRRYCYPSNTTGQCCAIKLPRSPVQAVLAVQVDGVTIDDTTYSVVGGNQLVRAGCWPASTDCEPGRIEVTYQAGIPLRPGSRYYDMAGAAMGEVTREYVEAMCGRPCKLPSRFVAVSRQGVSTAGLDPSLFLRLGLTGMPLTDDLIRTINPNGLRRKPRVVSIDGPRRY